MKQFNKKGFTIVELIIVIAIVAVLASILIPTFANVINKANDSAYQQERTNQMIKDVTEKVENSKWLSQEDFEKALAEALADNGQGVNIIEIIDDYYKNHKSEGDSTGISAEQVQKIIEQALAGKLTDNQVKVIIEKAVGDTLSEKDVKDIIEKALKDLPQTGITADELKAAVAKAVEGLAKADEIKQLIDNAINNLPALTEDEIKAIIENAINNAESKKYVYVAGANPAEFDEEGNIYVYRTFAKLNTVELTAAAGKKIHLIIDAPNVSTINVNGEYSEIEVQSTAPTSTHIKNIAEKVTLNSGRVVIESGATVTEFTAAPATNSKTVVVNEGTIETLYLEYQEHGYAAGNRDYIEVVNSNTVNAIIKASPDLESGEQSTTNVVLEGVGTVNSNEIETGVVVEYTQKTESGNKEYVADKTGSVAVESIEGVARIGKQGYSTLQAAIDAAENGNVVVLLKDINVETGVTMGGSVTYAATINKSLVIDGCGFKITTTTDRVLGIKGNSTPIDVTIKNISLIASNKSAAQCIYTNDNLNSLTLDNVIADNTAASSGYIQAITVSYKNDLTSLRHIKIKNSKVLNQLNKGYTIILWVPVEMEISNSEIQGWSPLYFKPNTSGSSVSIEGGKLSCVGVDGKSNSFGLINFEAGAVGIPVQINNTDINVKTEATVSYQSIVSFSSWYGPNNGSVVTIDGGSITLTGEHADFVMDNGADNSLIVTNCKINNNGTVTSSYSYTSPELENFVAYMYKKTLNNQQVNVCDGYFEFTDIVFNYSSMYFCDGEWFEFYSPSINLTKNVTFNMNSGYMGSFGLILGDSTLNANGYKITIAAGVTIKTDKQLTDVFAAPQGYTLVETAVQNDSVYSYSYTVQN